MSLIGRAFGKIIAPWRGGANAATLSNPPQWFRNWLQGNPGGESDPYVNEHNALKYLAVYSCVSLISAAIGGLPLPVYQRVGRGRQRASDHPAYWLLHDEYNPDCSAMTAREAKVAHLLTWGNAYSQIVRKRNGDPDQLRLIAPDLVQVRRAASGLVYDIIDRDTARVKITIQAEDMLHVPGLGFDGLTGYTPIQLAKTTIRAGMAQDREAEKFVTRGVRPPGAIKFPPGRKFATPQDAVAWRKKFNAIHQSADSAQEAVILEDGAEWQNIGIDPESAQLLESRKFTRGEICGLYRVPPHMIGDVEKTTSWGTGIEEQAVGFVTYTLLPWMRRIEQEFNRKLFGRGSEFYCEHLVDGLLRGDTLKRSQALEVQHRRGVLTDNEWREIENRNPVEGGDVRHYPLNEGRVDESGQDMNPVNEGVPA